MEKLENVAHKIARRQDGNSDGSQFSSAYQHPPQTQDKPGLERDLEPKPTKAHIPTEDEGYQIYLAAGKLEGKRALITGGDSGIGRAVAILFAMEGARVAITHLPEEEEDALHTQAQVKRNGGQATLLAADLRSPATCRDVVEQARTALGGLDILVNNAGYQMEKQDITGITEEQWARTFQVNIDAVFHVTKAAIPYLKSGASIINTTSVDAYIAPETHLDYAASKGALLTFTRALANQQAARGIRVNAVAPGPVWTPLLATSLSQESQKQLPSWTAMKRIGQPSEIATSFVFLASQDSSYMTGQTLHPNGGIQVAG